MPEAGRSVCQTVQGGLCLTDCASRSLFVRLCKQVYICQTVQASRSVCQTVQEGHSVCQAVQVGHSISQTVQAGRSVCQTTVKASGNRLFIFFYFSDCASRSLFVRLCKQVYICQTVQAGRCLLDCASRSFCLSDCANRSLSVRLYKQQNQSK